MISSANAEMLICERLMTKYRINYEIKTDRGWKRVCNNKKLQVYTKLYIEQVDYDSICNCVKTKTDNNSRALGSRLK